MNDKYQNNPNYNLNTKEPTLEYMTARPQKTKDSKKESPSRKGWACLKNTGLAKALKLRPGPAAGY
jgi:hypothetical protein